METAGNKEFEEDTEKKGLGTPATRAGIIEKLIASQYAVRKGKQILPTEDGKVLIDILPDFLKSATMTAEWENQLLEMEQGKMAPGQFMTGIEKLLSMMLNHCDSIPEEETRRFQKKKAWEPVRSVVAWSMKERKISIAVIVNVIFVSGKKISIYRVWKRIWMSGWLRSF